MMATSATVVNLRDTGLTRDYSVGVYAVGMALAAVFAAIVGMYVLARGNEGGALAALGAGGLLAVLAWGMWHLKPWRYTLGYAVHVAGILLGIYQFLVWLRHVITLINTDPAIAESGRTWAAIWRELPAQAAC